MRCKKNLHDYEPKDVRNSQGCPECKRARNRDLMRKWYAANRGVALERQSKWRKQNAQKHRDNGRKWREQNLERHRENARNWAKANPERCKENQRKLRSTPEGKEKHRKSNLVSLRKIRATPEGKAKIEVRKGRRTAIAARGDLTAKQLLEIDAYYTHCAYCFIELTDGPNCETKRHHDHVIPLERGGEHTKSNVVCACRTCNLSKGVKDLYEWLDLGHTFLPGAASTPHSI